VNDKLPSGKVRVKISGDGARMTRLTNYVILSYCLLDNSEDVLLQEVYQPCSACMHLPPPPKNPIAIQGGFFQLP
jgi:hypothetical protein